MKVLRFSLAVLASFSLLVREPSVAAPPNIVMIVIDDLGYGDLGCYGSTANHTPHIDRLAKQSVRFTDYHTSGPMCTPSRVSILTGMYQQRFGPLFDGPLSGLDQRHVGLPQSARTIASLLKPHGYATACLGKWHLGFSAPHRPTDHGFDVFRGLLAGDGDHHSHIDRYGNEDWWHDAVRSPEAGYTADLLTQHAVRFIQQNRKRPFLLYIPHLAIHFPWQGRQDPAHRVAGKDYQDDKWGVIPNERDVRPHVRAMLKAVDTSTGRVLDQLERCQLTNNTIVIVTSDNGGYLNYGGRFHGISNNGPLRGQKGTLYEGGHRVPLIVRWPNKVPARTCDVLAHSNDLLPTIFGLAGLPTPKSDGIDLTQTLCSQIVPPERTLFWRAGKEWAVRRGPWKYVYEGGRAELFNLKRDMAEATDLAAEFPAKAARLRADWEAWNAQMPQ